MQFFIYLGQVSLYGLLMWGIYYAVWRNRAFHSGSRIYLLLSAVLPALLPAIHVQTDAGPVLGLQRIMLPEVMVNGSKAINAPAGGSAMLISFGCYITVCFAIAALRLSSCIKLSARLRKGETQAFHGYSITLNTGIGPGTAGKWIFFPDGHADDLIISHELAHIRRGHRFDVALLQLICIVFWVSPAVWLIGRELKMVHEFEADAAATADRNAEAYAETLLSQTFGIRHIGIVHSFFHHPIKRRMLMLQKKIQKPGGSAYTIATAIVLTLAFTASALIAQTSKKNVLHPKSAQQKEAGKTGNIDPAAPAKSMDPGTGVIYKYVDQQPEFDGNLSKFLSGQLHYPDSARAHNQQGRSVVKFVVNERGKIVSSELVRSSGFDLLDEEALRVVSLMPAWKPGKQKGAPVAVYFTLPITFKLDN